MVCKPPFAEPGSWDKYQCLQEQCISLLAARGTAKVCTASSELQREAFACWSKPPFWEAQGFKGQFTGRDKESICLSVPVARSDWHCKSRSALRFQ